MYGDLRGVIRGRLYEVREVYGVPLGVIEGSLGVVYMKFVKCMGTWEGIREGPNSGITSFDNIGLAMLTVFQVSNTLPK